MTPIDLRTHVSSLYQQTLMVCQSMDIDTRLLFWLATERAWTELLESRYLTGGPLQVDFGTNTKTLLGIPVRITYDDRQEVEPLQIVMKPRLIAQAP
jgi:hypothetical protein